VASAAVLWMNLCVLRLVGTRLWQSKSANVVVGALLKLDAGELDRDGGDFCGVNVDEASVLATILEAYYAADLGEEGVVLAATDVCAGLERGSTLTDDDAATEDRLTAEYLDSEPLCV
jgi:hypothetical protein